MRNKIYNFLVNKHIGISQRYHKVHDGSTGIKRIVSYLYLVWMNFIFYCLFYRNIAKPISIQENENKNLPVLKSESENYRSDKLFCSVQDVMDIVSEYEIISFDIFDTLIFRPFTEPTDLFWLVGEKLGVMDFKNIRIQAEQNARIMHRDKYGDMEVNLEEIWNVLEKDTGLNARNGMDCEIETELDMTYANPFMLEVWKKLISLGKRIIVVSDMYLPENVINNILINNGFSGAEKVYISNKYNKSKADGRLFSLVTGDLFKDTNCFNEPGTNIRSKHRSDASAKKSLIVHIGDNAHSDVKMAVKNGWDSYQYQNTNKYMYSYRPYDMSPIVGSAYRAIINNNLYNGTDVCPVEYEFGFIYGGLFVVGYCNYIHQYVQKNGIDIVLFLSRDGDILEKVYKEYFPEDNTAYVYWSRNAATICMSVLDRHDFFRRFVYHKINQGYKFNRVLKSMCLEVLIDRMDGLSADDFLTDRNCYQFRCFIEDNWDLVMKEYKSKIDAAGDYYKRVLTGCERALAVDIGWAGSGALALYNLADKIWNIKCDITGMVAGTNTIYNAEPDASEVFLQNGRLDSYLYSQSFNRDIMKKHDINKNYNVFWELLLSSPTPQFKDFDYYNNEDDIEKHTCEHLERLQEQKLFADGIKFDFGKYDSNIDGIRNIQRGILNFAREYKNHFSKYPYMFNISGRDSYAPMIIASSNHEEYLRNMEQKFNLNINVD